MRGRVGYSECVRGESRICDSGGGCVRGESRICDSGGVWDV